VLQAEASFRRKNCRNAGLPYLIAVVMASSEVGRTAKVVGRTLGGDLQGKGATKKKEHNSLGNSSDR